MFASTHNQQCRDFTVIAVNNSKLSLNISLIDGSRFDGKSTHVVEKMNSTLF